MRIRLRLKCWVQICKKSFSDAQLCFWVYRHEKFRFSYFRHFRPIRKPAYANAVKFGILKQCFGSGSMWIRIEMAPLDPDLEPYWQYRSGCRTVKMVSKKEKKIWDFKLKRAITILQKVWWFLLEPGSPQSMSLQQFVTENNISEKISYILTMTNPGSEFGSVLT